MYSLTEAGADDAGRTLLRPGAQLTNRDRLFVLGAVFAFFAIPVGAQSPLREISFAAGIGQFDASGTDAGPLAAVRLAAPLVSQWLLGDINFSYASFEEQFTESNTHVGVGEAQLQAQLPATHVRPYIGLGGGWLHYFNNSFGRGATNPTISGSIGLRVPVSPSLLVRGELRMRTWRRNDSGYHNSAAEFSAGMGYAF